MLRVTATGTWSISEITRRDVFDFLTVERLVWSGRMDEPTFLSRIYDLKSLPSTDRRFADAAGDIHQHCIRNNDWDYDWVFYDDRFELMHGPDTTFLRFLCEMLHPVVRPDGAQARQLAQAFNERLVHDGWELADATKISGRPLYTARRRQGFRQPTDAVSLGSYPRLSDPQVLHDHLRRIQRNLSADPAAAIGASREMVESVLKLILDDYGVEYRNRDDLGSLYKLVQQNLALNAEAIPESRPGSQAAVKTLRALVSTVGALAELRNTVGSGHGHSRSSPALTRHARLAFNATVTITEFLLETWHERLGHAEQTG